MEQLLKIKLNYKKNYSYAAYHSGFDLFDSIYLENKTDLAFSALKIQVFSAPNILLSAEQEIDYLGGLGHRFLSCDFVNLDISLLASARKILDVCVTVVVRKEDGSFLASQDFSLKILPYFYFSGIGDMLETAAFFVTPSQPELDRIKVDSFGYESSDLACKIYDLIKEQRITYAPGDHSGTVALPVRLLERVLKEKFASSFELALLYASALEAAELSPVLAFAGKGRVFCGFSLHEEKLPLIHLSVPGNRNLDDYTFIDASDLAVGSGRPFETAVFQGKNALSMSDEKIVILSIKTARSLHLLPMPNRFSENGNYILSDRQENNSHRFGDFDKLWKDFSDDERVKSILLGNRLSVSGKKTAASFQADLDVNQNKILSKVLSNDFTLIRAQTGVGVSTLFSRATELSLDKGEKVLYITDSEYHPDQFQKILKKSFDQRYTLNLLKDDAVSFEKEEKEISLVSDEELSDFMEKMQKPLSEMDQYYASLYGDKRIVSSFLVASDRCDQLQDANDSIIFSPEQVGQLTDEMVQGWFSTVNEIVRSATEIGVISDHPLQLIRNQHFSYEYKSKLIQKLEDLIHTLESISNLREQVLPLFPSLNGLLTLSEMTSFGDLVRLFSDFDVIPEGFFENPVQVEDKFRKVTRLIQAKEENDSILQIVNVSFFETVLDLDARELYTRYSALAGDKGFKAISQKHNILKTVKRYLKPNCDVENIEYVLSRLYHYQKNKELLDQEKSSIFSLLSISSIDEEEAWKKLPISSDLCYQCYAVFHNAFDIKNLKAFVSDFIKAKSYIGVLDKVSELREQLELFGGQKKSLERLVFNEIDFFYPHSSREVDYFANLHEKILPVLSAADQLKNWCSWLTAKEKAISIGLKNVIVSLEGGKVQNSDLKRGFLRAFFKAVCEYNFISHPELIPENFDLNECISSYKEAASDLFEKQVSKRNAILSERREKALSQYKDSLPKILEMIEEGSVTSVYPCIISDLEKAKKLFSRKKYAFDLILIESRNLVPLEDMIWTFFAGRKVAFAGGFSSARRYSHSDFDLSNPAFDYLWKITDEKYSLSASYFSKPLLTDFKNSYFSNLRSDARYYTAPADKFENVVEWRILPGTFNGEYPGANLYEAKCVVDELVSFAMSESKKSIGVIASTVEQKKLILRLFAQKLRHQEDLAEVFSDYKRFFVSAIGETIFPCDKLIFSATFGADRSLPGSRLDFSILEFATKDPVKAIGAMLSCAKEEILVLSSFKHDELSFSPTLLPVNTAFTYLFDALLVPQRNCSYRVIGTGEEVSVIRRLRQELEGRGYKTLSGIQNGRYYIDLAVLNDSGDFVLGVLSDHTVMNYQANIAAIEIANLDYYEKSGWQIFRLHSAACFDSFETELQKILDILQNNETQFGVV